MHFHLDDAQHTFLQIEWGTTLGTISFMADTVVCILINVWENAVIYLVDITEVPDFNTMYELYDPCTCMFFFRNKHIMVRPAQKYSYFILSQILPSSLQALHFSKADLGNAYKCIRLVFTVGNRRTSWTNLWQWSDTGRIIIGEIQQKQIAEGLEIDAIA